MNLHKILKPYAINDIYYNDSAYPVLIRYLLNYSNAHNWFHYYGAPIRDSNNDQYFHYAVVYWTEGNRPTLNTFNFVREP